MVTGAAVLAPPTTAAPPGRRTLAAIIAGTLLGGLIAGEAVATGHGIAVLAFALLPLPVVIARRPDIGPVVVLVAALMIEQSPVAGTQGSIGGWTDHLPLFGGLGSTHLDPADLLLLGIFAIWILKIARPEVRVRRTTISKSIIALEIAVFVALLVGASHHGDIRIALLEVRPYAYLGATYFLASRLGTTERAVRLALWAIVIGSGIKAIQGVVVAIQVSGAHPAPDSVLGHEEAMFFGVFILATIAIWLFGLPGALRTIATSLLPLVIAADLANSRRTAFLILGVGFAVLIVLAYIRLPTRRRAVRRLLILIGLVSAVYIPVFWNNTGVIGQPARAVHSIFSPDPRDASSDLYRVQEDANLEFNIAHSGIVGTGFGVPIDYALPIVDISDTDPVIAYIPHAGLLYVVLRLGVFGAIAFWSVLAAGILGACRLLRARDRGLAVFGAIVICVLVAYVLEGSKDQGFYYFRVAMVVGTLLGLVDAALRRVVTSEGQGRT
jgi:hypothetical protein